MPHGHRGAGGCHCASSAPVPPCWEVLRGWTPAGGGRAGQRPGPQVSSGPQEETLELQKETETPGADPVVLSGLHRTALTAQGTLQEVAQSPRGTSLPIPAVQVSWVKPAGLSWLNPRWETPINVPGRECLAPVFQRVSQTSHRGTSPKSRRHLLWAPEHPHRAEGCGRRGTGPAWGRRSLESSW